MAVSKVRIFSALITLLCIQLQAQFQGPNASTYNPKTNKYYITNYYGKNVVSLDALGNKSTFISGLTAPNNILYADLPGLSGFVILDSNQVRAYDAAGVYYASYTTAGAVKFQDVVYDTSLRALFISDVERGVIYKTTFGGPPLYLPSTSVFSKPHRRPAGMVLQKNRGRLLYVEDTLGGNLMAMDLSTGTVSLVKALGIDHLIGLAEDAQGNLYFSSQGAKAIYQLNKYYSGSPRKLYNEPKPGDLLVNPQKDQWVYTCIICGTVFTPPLHLFGPGSEIFSCGADSFVSFKNYLHNNIGTFDTGNRFVAEMSDDKGSFALAVKLGQWTDTLIPDSMLCVLPVNTKAGNYRIRWRSTKPAVTGSFEQLTVYAAPALKPASSDTVQACYQSTIELGIGHDSFNTYRWSPIHAVDSPNLPVVRHKVQTEITLYISASSPEGCTSEDSVFIMPVMNPDAGDLADTIKYCSGNPATLGSQSNNGLQYRWTPDYKLSDSQSARPEYTGDSSLLFYVTVTAPGGCSSTDSQFVFKMALPQFSVLNDTAWICPGKNILNSATSSQASLKYLWLGPGNTDTTLGADIVMPYADAMYRLIATDTLTGCADQKTAYTFALPFKIPVVNTDGNRLILPDTLQQIRWYRNDTLIALDSVTLTATQSGLYKICGTWNFGCTECSPGIQINISGLNTSKRIPCSVYPVPSGSQVHINCQTAPLDFNWTVLDFNGRKVLEGTGATADLNRLMPGMYQWQTPFGNFIVIKSLQ